MSHSVMAHPPPHPLPQQFLPDVLPLDQHFTGQWTTVHSANVIYGPHKPGGGCCAVYRVRNGAMWVFTINPKDPMPPLSAIHDLLAVSPTQQFWRLLNRPGFEDRPFHATLLRKGDIL
jgi:hypothetical protein